MRISASIVCTWVAVALTAAVVFAKSPDVDQAWSEFKNEFAKVYASPREEALRFSVFADNFRTIRSHNRLFAAGTVFYEMGINRWSDQGSEEVNAALNGYRPRATVTSANNDTSADMFESPVGVSVPASIDWVKKGAVTKVKNQGDCGSCWAFATTGALEGQHFRETRHLVSLSEQNLIDCSRSEENGGCDGGTMEGGFKYIWKNGGIDKESCYPYKARNDKCSYNPHCRGATATGYVRIPADNEQLLLTAVATVGPIAVAIHVDDALVNYKHGIYHSRECTAIPNHAVLVVGYGTDARTKLDYWLVKNSWGHQWGEHGYFRLIRNQNMCCIACDASYPTV